MLGDYSGAKEYQSFLSHFERSRTHLPQVAEAGTALKRFDAMTGESCRPDRFLKQAKAEYAKLP
jgi:hypothetical protein